MVKKLDKSICVNCKFGLCVKTSRLTVTPHIPTISDNSFDVEDIMEDENNGAINVEYMPEYLTQCYFPKQCGDGEASEFLNVQECNEFKSRKSS